MVDGPSALADPTGFALEKRSFHCHVPRDYVYVCYEVQSFSTALQVSRCLGVPWPLSSGGLPATVFFFLMGARVLPPGSLGCVCTVY